MENGNPLSIIPLKADGALVFGHYGLSVDSRHLAEVEDMVGYIKVGGLGPK